MLRVVTYFQTMMDVKGWGTDMMETDEQGREGFVAVRIF